MNIEDLGYDTFFETSRNKPEYIGLPVARVIAEHRGLYQVQDEDGKYLAKVTGKQMLDATTRENYPAVGDWVIVSKSDKEHATVRGILPRKTIIKRQNITKNKTQIIATNIDVAFIVESVDRDYNLNRIERYFALAHDGGVKPAIILNKIDLLSQEELDLKLTELKKRFTDTDIIFTSTLTDEGLDKLSLYIQKGKTYCFLGSSGVGKSSLINTLLKQNIIKTDSISKSTERGKHTTTNRALYILKSGGILIDNPGMREVGIINTNNGINDYFEELATTANKCKYVDCSHTNEPGCEILSSLNSGKLDEEKYSNYIKLKKEADYAEMTNFEKRRKDRQFGKFIKTAKKDLKKFKPR